MCRLALVVGLGLICVGFAWHLFWVALAFWVGAGFGRGLAGFRRAFGLAEVTFSFRVGFGLWGFAGAPADLWSLAK